MKFLSRNVVAWLLPLLLTGCIHKTNQSQVQPPLAPPIEDTPPMKPDKAPANLPPPVISVPQPPPEPAATNQEPPKPAPKHHKPAPKPAQAAAPEPPPQQQASNAVPEVPAIGKLSSGDPPDLRKQTEDSIADIERGLKAITRKLNDQEQKTSTQITEFLKQARAALTTGDVDGAKTLTLKAKVLLGELNQ